MRASQRVDKRREARNGIYLERNNKQIRHGNKLKRTQKEMQQRGREEKYMNFLQDSDS